MITRMQNGITGTESPPVDVNGQIIEPIGPFRFKPITIWVIGDGEITGGKISVEEAQMPDYEGAWSVLEEISLSDLDGGGVIAVHLLPANYRAIRARLSEAVAGTGNVSVDGDIA